MSEKYRLLVCDGTSCHSDGGPTIYDNLVAALESTELKEESEIIKTGCFGFCEQGPIVVVYPPGDKPGTFYCQVSPEDAERIVNQGITGEAELEDLFYEDPKTGNKVSDLEEIDFYQHQKRTVLQNCGAIDPFSLEDYKANGGYKAATKVVNELTAEEVIEELKESGLRGRGGGGFPTGTKIEIAAEVEGSPKYIICNADEGDPGAFMDRSILEGDPHSVLEGLLIAGYTIGAEQGYVYVRAEYPLAVNRVEAAIETARDDGILGENVLDSDFNFDIEVRIGAGAFVCGEETALITSVEGYRGDPKPKPPYPAQQGLWDQPTLINNVETLANIPLILREGGEWYSNLGTEESAGTKVFALAGDINNTGLIEVEMGTTLREVIFELGGGIPDGKEFKAAQTGGPSGGCLDESELETTLEYESLVEAGSMMGSGGLIILDETSCMVDVAQFYLDFTQDEACGKCTSGRIGTKRMLEVITRIVEGEGSNDDLELLERVAEDIKQTALCGLCKSAPNPVLSTLDKFEAEYKAHVEEQICPAGVCFS